MIRSITSAAVTAFSLAVGAAPNAGANDSICVDLQRDLAAREYRPSKDGAHSFVSANRAHDLRVRFDRSGVVVRPRGVDRADFEWGLALRAHGRGNALDPATPVAPALADDRVEYRRGDVVEWFTNGAGGIEHGFTFATRPAGCGALIIAIDIRGSLSPSESGGGIDFTGPDGEVALRYDHLVVFDADGRVLPSTLGLVDRSLRITVDDRDARFPLVVDPLATSPSWVVESNQNLSYFGAMLGTVGDVNADGYSDVAVGASLYDNGQLNEGAVFIYHGSPTGPSTTPTLMLESNQGNGRLGFPAATAGDVNGDGFADLIAGAQFFSNGESGEGHAFVYLGSAGGLVTTPAWHAESDQVDAGLGFGAATAGDVNGDGFSDVIVGAPSFDNGFSSSGKAWVYHGGAAGPSLVAAWTAEGNQPGALFGIEVSTAGDVNGDGWSDVIVGAELAQNGQGGEGLAFVYTGSASGLSISPAWMGESNQTGAMFGDSVSTAGDVNGDGYSDVLIGARQYSNGQMEEGREYVFAGSAAGLSTTPLWIGESNQPDALLGVSSATAGDVNGDGFADILGGAWFFDGAAVDGGRAYMWLGSTTGPSLAPSWTTDGIQGGANYGFCVATAGDVNGDGYSDVLVGAHLYDNGTTDEGRAFLFLGSPASLATSSTWTGESDSVGASLGSSVASAGDVNGDGYSDVIAGAPFFANAEFDEGAVFVNLGSPTGPATSASWSSESNHAGAQLGFSVAGAGDVNGDGYSDVVAGAWNADNGEADEGRAFLWLGSAAGIAASPAWNAEGNQPGASFGRSVASAGDVNGDGYPDVIVGADRFDNGQPNEGRAFVYLGSGTGLSSVAAWTAESDQRFAAFGSAVASAGDVDQDGISDVIVGASAFDNGEVDEGRAFAFYGSTLGPSATPDWTAESNQVTAAFGSIVATAGDVDGDGFSDVIVGAAAFDNGHADEGAAFLYRGSVTGLGASPAWTAEGNQALAAFGAAASSAGDVDLNGFGDVVVGARAFTNGEPSEGRAFTYFGSASGISAAPPWTAESNQALAQFACSVANAGDVNGDGASDVVVGAARFDNAEIDEGRAFVYSGAGAGRLPVRLQQRRPDDSAPIASLGKMRGGSFAARMRARSPFGREDARLQVEVKPLSAAFDGNGTISAPIDTGVGGADAALAVTGLAGDAAYHWRARIVHDRVTTPLLPAGPWFTSSANGPTETDARSAPCGDSVASAINYGTGKPGTNGVPTLTSSAPPAIGESTDLTLAGGVAGFGPVFIFTGFFPAAGPFDGGTLLVNIFSTIILPGLGPGGTLTIPIAVPYAPSWCGLPVFFQAGFVDPGARGPNHTALTPGLQWTLGS